MIYCLLLPAHFGPLIAVTVSAFNDYVPQYASRTETLIGHCRTNEVSCAPNLSPAANTWTELPGLREPVSYASGGQFNVH